MKIIAVASRNPVKLQSALAGFQRMFPGERFVVEPVLTTSGVGDQPFSDAETLQGALHRAQEAARLFPGADYWVGIEGGGEAAVIPSAGAGIGAGSAVKHEAASMENEMAAFAWVVVLAQGRLGKARTGAFTLPPAVASLVREGKELGEADDIVFGRSNSKQENGAVGLLTGDVIDRRSFYEQAVILALIPFKNPELYA